MGKFFGGLHSQYSFILLIILAIETFCDLIINPFFLINRIWFHKFPIPKIIEASIKEILFPDSKCSVKAASLPYLTVSEFLRRYTTCPNDLKPGGNFLTTQKILQEQYTRDFKHLGMNSVYSSTNYKCKFHKQNTCGESSRLLRTAQKGDKFWNTCMFNCPYKKAKTSFIDGALLGHNFFI